MPVSDALGMVGTVRLMKRNPEEKGTGLSGIEKGRKRRGSLGRVPLELLLSVGTDMGLGHHSGEVALCLQVRRKQAHSVGEGSVQVFGSGGMGVLAGENADARRTAL